jgi:hypothetical protein
MAPSKKTKASTKSTPATISAAKKKAVVKRRPNIRVPLSPTPSTKASVEEVDDEELTRVGGVLDNDGDTVMEPSASDDPVESREPTTEPEDEEAELSAYLRPYND